MKSWFFQFVFLLCNCFAHQNVYFISTFNQNLDEVPNNNGDSSSFLASFNENSKKIDTILKFYSSPYNAIGVDENKKIVVILNCQNSDYCAFSELVSAYSFEEAKLIGRYILDTAKIKDLSVVGLNVNKLNEPELIVDVYPKPSIGHKIINQKINLTTKNISSPKPDLIFHSLFTPSPYIIYHNSPIKIHKDSIFLFGPSLDDSVFLKKIINPPKKWCGNPQDYYLSYWDDSILVINSRFTSPSDSISKTYFFTKNGEEEKIIHRGDYKGKSLKWVSYFKMFESLNQMKHFKKYEVCSPKNAMCRTIQLPGYSSQIMAYNDTSFVLKKDSCLTVVDFVPNSSLYKEHPKVCAEMINRAAYVFFGQPNSKKPILKD